ncbi:DUF3772 domain-containing protein [Enterovirga rhinocerotis]|uniref:Small-conductance mechanosensitive channel n=1 Tax=Enterovirga rhinocerotis TaxID=1339210 RepID=A0A4R7C9Q1_9HYPH|nr:DUF3772 domain-containing protein [Enterovirga rhinocerotis]TDR93666.1 small-conductance mechanosensitive channel [Enterovirga rhinocerotis]
MTFRPFFTGALTLLLVVLVLIAGALPLEAQAPVANRPPAAAPAEAPAAPATPAPAPAPAPAPPEPSPEIKELQATLDGIRKDIERAEKDAADPEATSDRLQELRAFVDPLTDRLRQTILGLEPKLDAARVRLNQLGPKPSEAEGAEVARDRVERTAEVGQLDDILKRSRALLVQAEQLTAQISDRRRATFTRALFQRSYSILSPSLWVAAASSFPRDLAALEMLAHDAHWRFQLRSSPATNGLLALALGICIGLHIVRRKFIPRLIHRDPDVTRVSAGRKILSALGVLAVETLPAVLASIVLYQALILLDVLPIRAVPVAWTLLAGIAFLAFVRGLIDAIFAPSRPAWRLVEMPDSVITPIFALSATFALIVVIGRIADSVNQAIAAGLPLSIAVKSITAIVAAAALALLLHRLAAENAPPEDACLGPYIPTGAAVAGPIRMLGWLLVILIIGGTIAGYVAFSSFLLDQITWIASLAGILYLALKACDHFIGGTLEQDSRISTILQTNLGLRRKALQQLGVVASGVIRVMLWVSAAMLALASWGIQSDDFTSSFRLAFFGFRIGDVTISLSTIISAFLLFGAVMGATRLVQRWLSSTLLPTTDLDAGLRNSLSTAAGYLGFFLAAGAAMAYLGLSLERIAIVAGALSVGIGFGLQSIVNNFVSGLILLWERPIRVGDLVVVGGDEGHVRKISVRATEIQTFDRSTLIVPNSSLISGTVKNRMRQDTISRIVISINVARTQDPVRAAELLVEQATSNADVMKEPPPRVFFKKIGDTFLEFDLVCFVDDVSKQGRVQSELNFAILKSLVTEGIFPTPGPGAMNVGGLEPVQTALQQIAEAIGGKTSQSEGAAKAS